MSSAVRLQYWRIFSVYALIAGIVVWQWHFIDTGIRSNPYLNLVIIGVFVFGSLRLVAQLFQLRNEGVAFTALKEVWSDVQSDREGSESRMARFERAFEPGRLYKRPKLLGHIFELTLEELQRSRQMRISLSTMQNLMNAVDGRIALDRSLVGYLSGLCIFLGLIGTFIGLMEMVQSVGGIIGSVASDSAAVNPTEAVQKLIQSLQAPLSGMATGFSSSLFGLFGSLVLGLVAKFVSQATGALRDEFEAWLAGISEIEGKQAGPEMPGLATGQLGGLAVSVLSGLRRSQEALDHVAGSVAQLGERQAQQVELLGKTVDQLQQFAAQEAKIRQALGRTDAIWQQLGKVREDLHRVESAVTSRVADGFEAVSVRVSSDAAATLAALQQIAAAQSDLGQRIDAGADGTAAAVAALGEGVVRADDGIGVLQRAVGELAARQERDTNRVAQVMAEVAALAREGAVRAQAAETAARSRLDAMDRLAARSAETSAALQSIADITTRQPEAMAAALRPVLAEGFATLSRSLADNTEALSQAVGGLAIQQSALAASLESSGPAKAIGSELREVARVIEGSMTSGFGDLARSVEGIFLSYAELTRRSGVEEPVPVPSMTAPAAAEAQPAPLSEPHLHELARRRHPIARATG